LKSRLQVIENGTILNLGYGFLLTFHSNYGPILIISKIQLDSGWKPHFSIHPRIGYPR